ncbi:hemolysin expression modulating protein [Streptococcus bovimastitidis]|uniref:Hemolysin expression modulating protein n=1 Tax=Streptococcus bovimastitidis TaxID=1856638 RepID=A0A1L8MQ60_9STRE|nr:SdpI family protein [Streptococcus bovimastitidis]OJF72862.1 hemolysin expression modulating protein [Streptococcus bovimastitidis]
MKINKKHLLITSLVTLLPILIGLLLWKQLPNQVPTHFDFSGKADDYSSKTFAVFFLPLFMLAIHLFTVWLVSKDPKSGRLRKMAGLVYWIVPAISLFAQTMVFFAATGSGHGMTFNANIFMGLVFLVIGNYLPKIRQNYTVGIRVPWTLNNENNWNKTHRLAGKVWVAGGLLILIFGLLKISNGIVFGILLTIMIAFPIIYSYRFYKNGN